MDDFGGRGAAESPYIGISSPDESIVEEYHTYRSTSREILLSDRV